MSYQVLVNMWVFDSECTPITVTYREKQEYIPEGYILVGDDLTLEQAIELHDYWYGEICRANNDRWNRGDM